MTRRRARVLTPLLRITAIAIAIGGIASSCLDLSWKEGIACDGAGHCPGALLCCNGSCHQKCAEPDATSPVSDGPPVITCPAEIGGCFACMPGCPCACGTIHGTCCLQVGVATCAGCP